MIMFLQKIAAKFFNKIPYKVSEYLFPIKIKIIAGCIYPLSAFKYANVFELNNRKYMIYIYLTQLFTLQLNVLVNKKLINIYPCTSHLLARQGINYLMHLCSSSN